jgi:hypothetical protein
LSITPKEPGEPVSAVKSFGINRDRQTPLNPQYYSLPGTIGLPAIQVFSALEKIRNNSKYPTPKTLNVLGEVERI